MILIDDKQNIVADTKKTLNKNEDLEILKKPSLNLCCLKIKTKNFDDLQTSKYETTTSKKAPLDFLI